MKKLRIFFYIMLNDGTGYYRMAEPARMINKLGLAEVITNPFKPYKPPKDCWVDLNPDSKGIPKAVHHLVKVLGWPKHPKVDAIVIQRADTLPMLSMAVGLRETYNVPIIQENDDYVFDVPQSNPGSLDYRERKQEHQLTPDDPFMVARRSLGVFDGYITTTPYLKNFFGNYSPTYECPNSIDLSQRKLKKQKSNKDFRIMFSSSAGHLENLELIEKPMTRILEKYPNVTFYYYHFLPNLWKGTKLEKQTKAMKFKEPSKYWSYIQDLNPDICLAPLVDRNYNRGKSNLRLLEYWSSKRAVICSPVGHYAVTVKDGENAIFAKGDDQWVEKIEQLMENPKLREKIGEGGYKTLQKDFNLETNARLWVNAVRDVVKNYDPNRQPPDQYLEPSQRSKKS